MLESHLGVMSISSSIIFLKEPSVNPFCQRSTTDSVSFNIGDVVSHEDISDISAASDEAESLYELDSHSLLDAGILMSILMYYVYVNSTDSIMNATDDSESENTTIMDTTMDEQCKN